MIKVEMQEKGETQRILKVEVPREEVDSQWNQITERIQRQASLPGFRRGKVPLDIVRQKYSQQIREEVLDHVFSQSYREALDQTHCVPIDQPRLEKMEWEPGTPLNYQVVLEVLPQAKLGNYRGLKLKSKKIVVTAAEVDDVLENLRQRHALLEPAGERPTQTGDVITLDFEGKRDGQPVPGTRAQDYQLELGSGQTIPDFEKNLLGLSLNAEHAFDATFPQDYATVDMAGTTVTFTVKVKAIMKKKISDLNDDFAKEMGGFQTLDELKTRIQADLTYEKERQNRILLKDQISKELNKSTQVKVPEVLIERSLAHVVKDQENRLARMQQTWEHTGTTPEEFKKNNRDQVAFELKTQLALREIALKETIEVTEDDLAAEVDKLARLSRQTPSAVRESLMRNHGWEDVKDRLRENKTLDFIIAQAKIAETD